MADSPHYQLHFVLIPLLAQGHMIPLLDMAKLLSRRGVIVTFVTTDLNASRIKTAIDRAVELGLPIQLLQLRFPCHLVGLPEGCENLDIVPSRDLIRNFYRAADMLQEPIEQYLQEQGTPPSCIISDKALSWTAEIARKFKIPRILFHGMGCFSLLGSHNVHHYRAHETVTSETEPFEVPGMPQKIEITKAQLPGAFVVSPDLEDIRSQIREAESTAYGVVVNSFEELEPETIEAYQRAIQKKVWCLGPVSLYNKDNLDKYERGNKPSIDKNHCLKWLDSMKPNSVLYACLGSQCRLVPSQLIELGLALEASNLPFIWAIKTGGRFSELEKWLFDERFEERIKGRGLLIKGWAPQVLILSHPAIRGFVTHCGWNSTIEGLCAGIPMITWPLFAEQFFNEKLIIQVLKIGVRVGVEVPVRWGEEDKKGVLVKREEIEKAIELLMEEGEEGEERKKRAKKLGEIARTTMEEGGSSYFNMTLLIEDILYLVGRSEKSSPRTIA